MSQLEEAIRDHEDRCERELSTRYVPWVWLVGILIGMIGAVAGVAYTFANSNGKQEQRIEYIVESQKQLLNKDMDLQNQIYRMKVIEEDIKWMREHWYKKEPR